ncbi:unnamed protein product [Lactuca virosa]|uniref:Helitron helicase-like domain-containing protein n=1 Tax=Lactuca virosa TaxID=75947 RepID=A0AAU9LKJ4_9ASTR|nr:unnamed protein product [Lactuca virosa]
MRSHDKSCLLLFGRLLQQYIVDSYIKLETQRLAFYRNQQQELRQEFLQGVVDAMASGETSASSIGQRVVLPATFIGGPQNMRIKYIDAMALVQKFGKPYIFVTLTCNPNWPEIKQHMMCHEETQNRADLIVRFFHAKLEQFKKEIFKNEIFGKVIAHTYVVEFQKRGLPHAHFLLILEPQHKMYHAEEYDEIVSAEIPDKHSNPHIFRMVVKHMLHGPCGDLNPKNGTRVLALVYSNDLDFFENTFKPYNRYQISNANLRLTEPRFQLDSYEFSWTLTKQTLIEPIEEQTPPPLPCQFHFTPFSELYKYADVRGVVIKCFPIQHVKKGSETSSKRDVIIVNEEKKLLILTLWNPIDEIEGNALVKITNTGPLVFAMRVNVTTFYGQSLTTSPRSAILINPPVKDDLALQDWYTINKEEIKGLLQNETYKDTEILLPSPENKDILPIGRAIIRMKNGKPTWIKGNLNLPHQDRSFTQTICAMCLKPIQADVNWNIKCPLCKEKSEVHIISRAIIEIDDGTGTIVASISTPEIEKLIPLKPNEIRDIGESEKNVHDVIASSVQGLSVVSFVRSYQSWNQQQQITRFVIVKLHKVQEHYTKDQQLLNPSTKSETLSTTKPASPKQTQKRIQLDVGKTKVTESSSVGTSRPTKK